MPDQSPYYSSFNTPLKASDEARFRDWIVKESQHQQRDMTQDLNEYDMRGWWKENQKKLAQGKGDHFSDKYKKPNHPTFSEESQYHNQYDPISKSQAVGGKWGYDKKDGDYYTPSSQMLSRPGYQQYITDYFNSDAEKGRSTLRLPQQQ